MAYQKWTDFKKQGDLEEKVQGGQLQSGRESAVLGGGRWATLTGADSVVR